jgi:hypothetical protein
MRARLVRGFTSVVIVGLLAPSVTAVAQAPPAPPPMTPCSAAPTGLKLICNQHSPEDLVVLPGNQWAVASAYAGAGGIHLIRASDHVSHRAYPSPAARKRPDEKRYSDCPGPPDLGNSVFTTHGLWLQPGSATVHTLFVVGHGSRESIEVFEIDTRPATPAVTWIGCVIAPDPIGLNSVRALPDGGFIATNFLARNITPEARLRMLEGDKNGELWEWHAAGGWKKVPGSESSGANGIEISNDGRWYYVAAWGSQAFFRLSRGAANPMRDEIRLGFRVDNIRWARDGSLYATGQTGSREVPETSSVVVKINPETLAVREVYRRRDDATFRFGTVAVEVGNELWIGSYQGDRIAVVPAP